MKKRNILWTVAALLGGLVAFWLFGLKLISTTEEFLDPDYPRRETTVAWAEAAGFERAERHGNWWTYTLNFRKPA